MDIIYSEEITVADTPTPLSADVLMARQVDIVAGDGTSPAVNSESIYLGKSDVTTAKGIPIQPEQSYSLLPTIERDGGYNLAKIFLVSASGGQKARIIAWAD